MIEDHPIQAFLLDRAHEALRVQAQPLDAIFNTLARRAAINMGEYPDTAELSAARAESPEPVPGNREGNELGGRGDGS